MYQILVQNIICYRCLNYIFVNVVLTTYLLPLWDLQVHGALTVDPQAPVIHIGDGLLVNVLFGCLTKLIWLLGRPSYLRLFIYDDPWLASIAIWLWSMFVTVFGLNLASVRLYAILIISGHFSQVL